MIFTMRCDDDIYNDDTCEIWILESTTAPLFFDNLSYWLMWVFLWCLRKFRLKRFCHRERHTNLTPKCTFLMWVQIVAHEVNGPSLQSLTQYLYTLLMPPTWTLRGCMWVRMVSSGAGGAAEEAGPVAWPAGSVALGPVDSWEGGWEMVVLEAMQGFCMRGWDGTGWEYDAAPFKSP